ncbi:MAG: ABC transporter ATP-binding protein [Firmicutes bacterium]|nr:ABC transporter ATP-binding protein [Candidatus Fermentithermobacillaceae bacterium]
MITAVNLSKRYGSLTAVDNLNLTVKPGEIFGFLGPNGAGKTTTIKMLVGLTSPTSGEAWVAGTPVAKDPVAAKRVLGYVPDTPHVYERLTARELLRFVGDLRRLPPDRTEKKIDELMALFELTDRQDELLGGFSHGMKQKVCIACALLGEPKVLFLDEPTVGLDPRSARLVKDILRRIADDGGAVFVSPHVLEIAERMCDRVGIIQNGVLIAEGTVEELRSKAVPGKEGAGFSLEDLFLKLTGGEEYKELISHLSSDQTSSGDSSAGDVARRE